MHGEDSVGGLFLLRSCALPRLSMPLSPSWRSYLFLFPPHPLLLLLLLLLIFFLHSRSELLPPARRFFRLRASFLLFLSSSFAPSSCPWSVLRKRDGVGNARARA